MPRRTGASGVHRLDDGLPACVLDVVVGQNGYGRVPAYLPFELQLVRDKVFLQVNEIISILGGSCAVELYKPLCYAQFLVLGWYDVET